MGAKRIGVTVLGLGIITWVAIATLREMSPTDPRPVPEDALVETVNSPDEAFPLPEVQSSRFLNTREGVAYVGSQKCAACHAEEFRSYSQTTHSQAMSNVDVSREPPDVEYFHEASRKWYRVERRQTQMWHSETIRTEDGDELVLNEHPMAIAVGSGHHSRSYLADIDGFLIESPITWYASRAGGSWDMSPGYDRDHHQSFERMTNLGCLVCHTGQAHQRPSSAHQVDILEQAVGCEKCHGPGELHVERHRQGKFAGGEDLTIVNPVRLEESLSESICGQCHKTGEAAVTLRGRDITDYRPGLPLNDFKIDYSFAGSHSMKVVGHGEQMRASRCYTSSGSMSCTTCHDPHAFPSPEQRVEHYRSRCMTCHDSDSCGLELAKRHESSPSDNCAQCHMPKTGTDIPHFTFSHHRIAIPGQHQLEEPGTSEESVELVATDDVAHLASLDQRRNLGLAYAQAARETPDTERQSLFRKRAEEILSEVLAAGLTDPEVMTELSVLKYDAALPTAAAFATRALESDRISRNSLVNALFIAADAQITRGNFADARPTLERLVHERRFPEDWFRLGVCRHQLGDEELAIAALQKAIEISPERIDLRSRLVQALKDAGRTAESQQQQRKLEILGQWLDEEQRRAKP